MLILAHLQKRLAPPTSRATALLILTTYSSYSIGGEIVVTERIDHQQMQLEIVASISKICWQSLAIGDRAVVLLDLVVSSMVLAS